MDNGLLDILESSAGHQDGVTISMLRLSAVILTGRTRGIIGHKEVSPLQEV